MGKYNMVNSEKTLEILYRVRICREKKTDIANDVKQHRNTIMRIVGLYDDCSDEDIADLYERYKNDTLSQKECDEIFCRHTKEKLHSLDKKEISDCCRKYLNCNLSGRQYAEKLCKGKGVPINLVIDYDPDKISIDDYPDRRNIILEIQGIRRRKAVPKNYEEVYYDYYIKTARYAVNPISLSLFKKYLKENETKFWKDKKWIPNLGKCIDTEKTTKKNESTNTLS